MRNRRNTRNVERVWHDRSIITRRKMDIKMHLESIIEGLPVSMGVSAIRIQEVFQWMF